MTYTTGDADWDNIIGILAEEERVKEELQRHLLFSLIYGRQGYGKNYSTAGKIRQQAALYRSSYDNALDSRKMGAFVVERELPTELPQKVCNYRKPKLYWYGEMHPSNNFIYNPDFAHSSYGWEPKSRHWPMFVKGRDPKDGLSVWPAKPMGSTTGRRFVLPKMDASDMVDNDSLMRLTGDDFTTRTYKKGGYNWSPQGEIIFIGGSKLPQIKDKD